MKRWAAVWKRYWQFRVPGKDYLFLSKLGSGGQGDVWLAQDKHLDRVVTIKRLQHGTSSGPSPNRDSIRSRADIKNPTIPAVFGVIPDGRKLWLVGEYVKGASLTQCSDELGWESRVQVIRDLLEALICLERQNLVHCDLSPANIVIDSDGMTRLLDFELCHRVGATLSNTGTPQFSSPELADTTVALPSIDVFSFGALVFWLLTGSAPKLEVDDRGHPIVMLPQVDGVPSEYSGLCSIAARCVQVDASLRPAARDLLDKIQRDFRWLSSRDRHPLASVANANLLEGVHAATPFDFPDPSDRRRSGQAGWSLVGLVLIALGIAAYQPIAAPTNLSVDISRVAATTELPEVFSSTWLVSELEAAFARVDLRGLNPGVAVVSCGYGHCALQLKHSWTNDGLSSCSHSIAVASTDDAASWRMAITELASSVATSH